MHNEWDDYADGWDDNASVQDYADKAFAALTDAIDIGAMTVLDFGCGTGHLTERMSPKVEAIVALDTSAEMIRRLTRKGLPNVTPMADGLTSELIRQQPVLHKGVDLVVASSVCGFLPDYPATMKLIAAVLKPGGWFVQWDWLSTDEQASDGMTKPRIENVLGAAGFSDIRVSVPFEMPHPDGAMHVVMGMAKKP
ncbi:class I SAM-dependent methyltransferase [Aestuariibacter halophilus]|uniref:Class I SAM-dependent methyltransferase n=1 Tax=Fluctibacter halophilus TaxID=226011 RepID=A0ABS8G2L2_9ALTE|nr:class I SAM-dependent methyltransferase [Aestuariibacter halophilus]MCC2614734.1 class I SAM-dependent methyltransferase [Aestuariibacter halophilus]